MKMNPNGKERPGYGVNASGWDDKMKRRILCLLLFVLMYMPVSGCGLLVAAGVGGTAGYVAGHEAGEDEAHEESHHDEVDEQ